MDNVIADPGSGGATFAADDISGVMFPRTKIVLGADGVNDGDLASANPMPVKGTGTAGTANSGVLTVQGIASMTPVQIADNGSSLTVDGTVAATQSGTWTVELGATDNAVLDAIAASLAGTLTVGSHAVTNAGTFPVQVDGSALTSLQLIDDVVVTEDAAHGSGDKGVMALAVRRDANTTLADTTGDYAPLQVDASGSLKVAITAGAGSGGTASSDDGAFTAGSGSGTPMMGFVTTDTVDSGDVGVVGMLANRQLKVTLYDSSANELSVGGGTQYDEDTAATGGEKLTMAGVVRADTAASLVNADGDRTELIVDGSGRLHVNVGNTVTVGSHAVTNAGTFAVQAAQSGTWTVQPGNTANTTAWLVTGTGGTFPVTDSGGTLTVDAPVGTPVFVRLSDGSSAITTLPVSIASVPSHAVTNAGTFAVQVDGSALTALQLIDDPVITDDSAFTPATSKVMMAGFQCDEGSTDSVDEGDAGAARMTLDRKVIVTPQPHTAGGLSIFRSLDLDETEEDVKTSPGQLYGWYFFNAATSIRYLKFYNATAANVTVGSTTPVLTIPLPAQSSGGVGGQVLGSLGIAFDTAISAAVTTGLADSDTGAPGTNDVILNAFYK